MTERLPPPSSAADGLALLLNAALASEEANAPRSADAASSAERAFAQTLASVAVSPAAATDAKMTPVASLAARAVAAPMAAAAPTAAAAPSDKDEKKTAAPYLNFCQLFGRTVSIPPALKLAEQHIPILQTKIQRLFAKTFEQWILTRRIVEVSFDPKIQWQFGHLLTIFDDVSVRLDSFPEPKAAEKYIRDVVEEGLMALEQHFAKSRGASQQTVPTVAEMESVLRVSYGIRTAFASNVVNVAEDDTPTGFIPRADIAQRFPYLGGRSMDERTKLIIEGTAIVRKRNREQEAVDANEAAAKRVRTEQ